MSTSFNRNLVLVVVMLSAASALMSCSGNKDSGRATSETTESESKVIAPDGLNTSKLIISSPGSEQITPSESGSFTSSRNGVSGFSTAIATDVTGSIVMFSAVTNSIIPLDVYSTAATIVVSCLNSFGFQGESYEEQMPILRTIPEVRALGDYINNNVKSMSEKLYSIDNEKFMALVSTAVTAAIHTMQYPTSSDQFLLPDWAQPSVPVNNVLTSRAASKFQRPTSEVTEYSWWPEGTDSEWAMLTFDFEQEKANFLQVMIHNYWLRDVYVYLVPSRAFSASNIHSGHYLGSIDPAPSALTLDGIRSMFDGDLYLNSTTFVDIPLSEFELDNEALLAFVGPGTKNRGYLSWDTNRDILLRLMIRSVLVRVIAPSFSLASKLPANEIGKALADDIDLVDKIFDAVEAGETGKKAITAFREGRYVDGFFNLVSIANSFVFNDPGDGRTNRALRIYRQLQGISIVGARSSAENYMLNLCSRLALIDGFNSSWNLVGFGTTINRASELAIYSITRKPLVCDTPSTITVPRTSLTGNYTVSWSGSDTTGVIYKLEESSTSDFLSSSEVYSSTATSAIILGKKEGIFFYRVKATKNGYVNSEWRKGDNGCTVAIGTTWYRDSDGDGYGNPSIGVSSATKPSGYVADNTDCNDASSSIHPGATDVCENTVDEDCSGSAAVCPTTWYRDSDGDGYGNPSIGVSSATKPSGYVADNTDCNDASSSIHPGATDVCENTVDEDCSGSAAICPTTWYRDSDGDGYGNPSIGVSSATKPSGYVADKSDCDDSSSNIHTGATDSCDNNVDEDCSGSAATCPTTEWYRDADGDSYGNPNIGVSSATKPSGYVADNTDCNDASSSIHPGATDVCENTVDEDCSGSAAVCPTTWYRDSDGDGYGNPSIGVSSATKPSGYVADNTDCNDASSSIHPGATDVCENTVDEDCSGSAAVCPTTWYRDSDGDGYGNPSIGVSSATKPSGYVADNTDCNDASSSIHPGATDVCENTVDEDCSGSAAVCPTTWYRDSDGDGYGNPNIGMSSATKPSGYVADNTDCDDVFSNIHPGANDVCDDGLDADCSGSDTICPKTWYRDADGDSYGDPSISKSSVAKPSGYVSDKTDCNDSSSNIHPDATDSCDNNVDEDCSGSAATCPTTEWYRDADGDGYGDPYIGMSSATKPSGYVADNTDCDDVFSNIHPGANDVCGDGLDADCSGSDACPPPDDHGDTCTSATAIARNQCNELGNIGSQDDDDYFKVSLPSSGNWTVYTEGSTDTYGTIFNSNCTSLKSNDDTGDGSNFKITYSVTSAGSYYIRVRGKNDTTGGYSLFSSFSSN